MVTIDEMRERPAPNSTFEHEVANCPKCLGLSFDSNSLRFCEPERRRTKDIDDYPVMVGEEPSEPAVCNTGGEHFHWRCHRCGHQRLLALAEDYDRLERS